MNFLANKRYNSYLEYMKRKHGKRIQKVTVDAGFTCPNRDGLLGSNGCIYCNNASFNPGYNSAKISISAQIEAGIEFLQRRYGSEHYIVYFQPYSNTYAPLEQLKKIYEEALSQPHVVGLTIGTRPDCVDEEILNYLAGLSETYDITVEYGLESTSDQTLQKINRCHDFQCYLDAVHLTASLKLKQCTHLILGFPWEDKSHWLNEAEILSSLPIDFLKIHQLHIVKETPLGNMYMNNPFPLLTFPEYLDLIIAFLERLNPEIVIQRLAGEAPPHMLIAPHWGMRASEIVRRIETEMVLRDTWQGKMYQNK